jgi:hypothetical protein
MPARRSAIRTSARRSSRGASSLMILAAIYHAQRPGEGRNIVLNLILGLLAAIVAFGRLGVAPF